MTFIRRSALAAIVISFAFSIWDVFSFRSSLTIYHSIPRLFAKSFGSKTPGDVFFCQECGGEHIKWVGRCNFCAEWNSVKQFKPGRLSAITSRQSVTAKSSSNSVSMPWLGYNQDGFGLIRMTDVNIDQSTHRLQLFSAELSRVLGGGMVTGSVVLIAGEPGIGKSTLLMQVASSISRNSTVNVAQTVVYISGEESAEQIVARAQRLELSVSNVFLICDVDTDSAVETIIAMKDKPSLVVVDSIQTMRTAACANAMGSVTQIRESAARFVQLAKSTGICVLLLGHVTKSGDIAGPRVLEHMVDTVLQMEGSDREDFRIVRAIKNRFGSASEVGIFAMSAAGLSDVDNPSEMFISDSLIGEGQEGAAVAVIIEGTRPILAEIQCLVGGPSPSPKINPRRTADGFPLQRLLLICAVIEKRLRLSMWNRDVYLNVAGGLRIFEPSADLAVAVTVVSSLLGMRILPGVVLVGEIGLRGELRGGRQLEQRIAEASKMGFKTVIVPRVSGRGSSAAPSSTAANGAGRSIDRQIKGAAAGRSASGMNSKKSSKSVSPVVHSAVQIVPCATLLEALSAALDGDFVSVMNKKRSKKKKNSPGFNDGPDNDKSDDQGMADFDEVRTWRRGVDKSFDFNTDDSSSQDDLWHDDDED